LLDKRLIHVKYFFMKHFQISETELWAYISQTADILTIQKVERWVDSPNFDDALFTKIIAIYEETYEPTTSIEKAESNFFNIISTKEKRYKWKKQLKYAAILLFAISATYTYMFLTSNNEITVETSFREQKQLKLSDGSIVWLNASSKLSYNEESPRTLYLEGEAYFDVVKDKEHPFTVSTSESLKVQALGTSFNVKSYINSSTIETKLITGKVQVTYSKNMKDRKLLSPYEKVTFYKNSKAMIQSKLKVNERSIAWKEGRIQFKNKIFKEIALDLKNQFNIKLRFQNEQIANSKFTGSFDYKLNTETNEWLIN